MGQKATSAHRFAPPRPSGCYSRLASGDSAIESTKPRAGFTTAISATLAAVVGASGVSWRQPTPSAAAATMITWSQIPNDVPLPMPEFYDSGGGGRARRGKALIISTSVAVTGPLAVLGLVSGAGPASASTVADLEGAWTVASATANGAPRVDSAPELLAENAHSSRAIDLHAPYRA